jgi:hypothetical protein
MFQKHGLFPSAQATIVKVLESDNVNSLQTSFFI